MPILRECIDVEELMHLFSVSSRGLHLKNKELNGSFTTHWPNAEGKFFLPREIKEIYLFALKENRALPSNADRETIEDDDELEFTPVPLQLPQINVPSSSKRKFKCGESRSSSSSKFNSSKNNRGNNALSFGSRCIPSLKKAKLSTKKNNKSILRSFSISEVVDDVPETMFKINIDLAKVERTCGPFFTVSNVAAELQYQLEVKNSFIVTDVKGFPVKDTCDSRGKCRNLFTEADYLWDL